MEQCVQPLVSLLEFYRAQILVVIQNTGVAVIDTVIRIVINRSRTFGTVNCDGDSRHRVYVDFAESRFVYLSVQ